MNVLLTNRVPVRSPEEIKASPHFAALSANQKEFVVLLARRVSPQKAVDAVYQFKTANAKQTAKVFMYSLLRKETMHDILAELYGIDAKAEFMDDVKRLSRAKDVTLAQVHSLILYGIAHGFIDENFLLFTREAVSSKDEAIELPVETDAVPSDYREAKRKFETGYLKQKLEEHGWSVTKTAASIGLCRQSLTAMLRELGIQRPVE